MAKHFLLACFACLVTTVQAAPFSSTQFDTAAVASAQSAADFQSDSSPPSALPIISSAVAIGTTDIATAGALATSGLLVTSADATGITGLASAVATSHFSGNFLTGQYVDLKLDLDASNFTTGTGFADTSLFVLLTVGATTLINDVFTVSDFFHFWFATPVGSAGFLDLLLVSEASADGGSDASSQATLQFALPLPATWWLLLIGIAAFVTVRAGGTRRRVQSPCGLAVSC